MTARVAQLRGPLVTAVALAAGMLALVLRDPHQHTWVLCPFKALTGWDCPACGGLRAVNDLGTFHPIDAVHSNLLLVASLPFLAVAWLRWAGHAWAGRAPRSNPRGTTALLATYAVLAVAFTVVRNTPWGSAFRAS